MAAAIVPTIAPTDSQMSVYSLALGRTRAAASWGLPAASSCDFSRMNLDSVTLSAQDGACCVEPHVPSNATPDRHAPSIIRHSVEPASPLFPEAAAWRWKKRTTG